MPIRRSLRAFGEMSQESPPRDPAGAGTVTRRKGRYRTKIIAKLIVLSAQLSNPIPAAAQGLHDNYYSGNSAFRSTHMQPDFGALQDCVHPMEPDLTGDRYRATQNNNRLLIRFDKTSEANAHHDVRNHAFVSAATPLIRTSQAA
jgi:hypothetical protein